MNKVNKIWLAATLVLGSLAIVLIPSVSAALQAPGATPPEEIGVVETARLQLSQAAGNYGLDKTAGEAQLAGGEKDLSRRIGQILYPILGFIGVIFLIITIVGGFMYMTAGGNPEQAKRGGQYIRNGLIGVIIIMASYAITFFVFTQLLGGSTTGNSGSEPPPPPLSCQGGGYGTCTNPSSCLPPYAPLSQMDCGAGQVCCSLQN
jgi:hypothetical protein